MTSERDLTGAKCPAELVNEAVISPSITSRVVVGAGWMVAWRAISRSLGFINLLVLASLLEPGDFGIVAMATAVTGAIEGLSQLGVRDALVRLAGDRRDYYDTAFTFQVVRGLLTATLVFGFSFYAPAWLGEPRLGRILVILSAVTIVSSFENIGVVSLSRSLDFRAQIFLQAVPRVTGFFIVIGLGLVLQSYWAIIVGTVFTKLMSVAVSYARSPHRPRLSVTGWQYLLHFSFWTWVGGLAIMVLARADPFLLGPVLGTAAFGLYSLASEIAALPVTELMEPACTALFPGFAMANRGGSAPAEMGLSVAGALALCTIPFSIGISACSGYLVASLLGPQWDAARALIAILAWSCVFLPFSWVAVTALSAQGQVRRVFVSHAIAAALKVLAILAVRDSLSLQLIATTMTVIVALESLVFIGQLKSAGNRELRNLVMTMLRAVVAGCMTCGALYALPGTWSHVELSRFAALFAGGAVGFLAFAVFFAVQTIFWHLCGRPPGAEDRIAGLVRHNPRVRKLLRIVYP